MRREVLSVIISAMVLTSCGSYSDDEDVRSHSDTQLDELIMPTAEPSNVHADLSSLSTEKHGYGQGVLLDSENRPTGALEFNSEFGKYNAEAISESDAKTIRLTFDQGYENGYTAKILDTLAEKNIKATFFVLDDYARRNPELVQRMIDEGHTVGNHSVTHRSMPSLSAEECREEVMGLHKYIRDEFGIEMTEFRPPMGEFSELSLAVTSDCGYKTVLWSFAYADWDPDDQPEPSAALDKLTGALHSGAIYLLHSVSSTNAEILGDFIDKAQSEGYTFI